MPTMSRVGVIGAGSMGSGIALLCASKGYQVYLVDVWPQALEKAGEMMRHTLDRDVQKGRLTEEASQGIWERLHRSSDISVLQNVEGVIEAVPEQEDVKCKIFQSITAWMPPSAWIATNTSSLHVAHLATFVQHPERFAGMHFFNPAPTMPLVELIRTPHTSPLFFDHMKAFVQRLGKVCIESADTPGFIVNRILLRMIREAILAWEEGVAPITEIDQALQKGANHPLGPLALADLIGIDVCLEILKTFQRAWPDQGYQPPFVLEKMVQHQWLGRKTSQGFYDYTHTPPQPCDHNLQSILI